MTEEGLIERLEALVENWPALFRLSRTAGLLQFYRLAPLDGVALLHGYYRAARSTSALAA